MFPINNTVEIRKKFIISLPKYSHEYIHMNYLCLYLHIVEVERWKFENSLTILNRLEFRSRT